MNPDQQVLFDKNDGPRYGDQRHHRNLFIPKLLKKETANFTPLRSEEQDNAYKIFLKWIDLETCGKLSKMKETALQGEFLTEIFGTALGYTLFSENADYWNLEPQFPVNGGFADAAIGHFDQNTKKPQAVIELKGPTVNLDKFSGGRTPVQQCWDYLYMLPDCPWGVVSNYVSFRLYNRNQTRNAYQLFILQDLRDRENFAEFYHLFQKGGLLSIGGEKPRAQKLLEFTNERQQAVGVDLYNSYANNRYELIGHLIKTPHNKSLDKAIYIAQRIIDRIIFVAFCEDRDLLPDGLISKAYKDIEPFTKVTNPKWQNFLRLFESVDTGNIKFRIDAYNGGLFKKDDEVDNLQLEDGWTDFFYNVSKYDFRDEVSVEVLGHLFEKSINDIEKIKKGGLFDEKIDTDKPKMQKSAERKKSGTYYTPPEFTTFIVQKTVGEVIKDRFDSIGNSLSIELKNTYDKPDKKAALYWNNCFEQLKEIKIVDPACGSGAFLIAAYDLLADKYKEVINNIGYHENKAVDDLTAQIPNFILANNLYGVDLSFQAVEITQLSLWIRTAQKGKPLSDLSKNIICGNSLVDDPKVHPDAIKWDKTFAEVFNRKEPGFDCVIGNPPWERIKVQEREFFDIISPEIAGAVNAAKRKKLIEELKSKNPDLHVKYTTEKELAEQTLSYLRNSGNYPLTGTGDINTYAVFAELAYKLVSPIGRVGILVPSGIATEHTTQEYIRTLIDSNTLAALYDFENLKGIFNDVHRSFKFCILLFGGYNIKTKEKDFVFFAHSIYDLFDKRLHIAMSSADIKLLNPNTRTCPIFRNQRDLELTKSIYKRIPILIDRNREKGGNPWGLKFSTMFHQTNDANLFKSPKELEKQKCKLIGANWEKDKKKYLPLFEAKMFRPYDHRFGTIFIKKENWVNQGQTTETTLVEHQNPEFAVMPRYWADEKDIFTRIENRKLTALLCFRNITRSTDSRTFIATFLPFVGVINSAPIMLFKEQITIRQQCCLLANCNSYVLDFVTKRKIGHINLNFFIIEQLPFLTPDCYEGNCRWDKKTTLEKWISERVLKLTCTSNDMIPLAEEAGFEHKVWKWKPDERAELMAELDAAYFILYGIKRDDAEYILSTFSGAQGEDEGLFDNPSIAARILKYYEKFSVNK